MFPSIQRVGHVTLGHGGGGSALTQLQVVQPSSSFSYPSIQRLLHLRRGHGCGAFCCLQKQVSQPYSSFWNPFGQPPTTKRQALKRSLHLTPSAAGLQLHMPQPRTTYKNTSRTLHCAMFMHLFRGM